MRTLNFNCRIRIIIFIQLLAFNAALAAMPVQLLSFENENQIKNIKTVNSKILLSDAHAKLGKNSLNWRFSPEGTLSIATDLTILDNSENSNSKATPSFLTWIYNEKATNAPLTISFENNGQKTTWFTVNLNFHGWRAIAVPYKTDMQGKLSTNYQHIVFTAPKYEGVLYFDFMLPNINVDPRWPTPDYQVPFVNPNISTRANAHWGALLQYDQWLINNIKNVQVEQNFEATLQKIETRIDDDLLSTEKSLNHKQINNLLKIGRKLALIEGKTLRPVQMWRQLEVYQNAHLPKNVFKAVKEQTLLFQKLGKHLLNLATAYRKSNDDNLKNKLLKQFTLLSEHLLDQGFVRGSAVGIMHHQGYALREWAQALFLMRNQLGNKLQQQQQAIAWFIGLGRIFRPEPDINGFNVDVMNTFLPAMVMSILMEENTNQKVALLSQLSHWMSYSTTAIKGLSGGIQPDGSFFHHSQHYVAYGNGGLEGLSPVVYYLSHTPFALSQEAYQRLKYAVMMTSKFSNGLKVPMSLSGRHPEKYTQISLDPFKYLAMMGDKDITSTYLRLKNVDPDKLNNSPVQPEPTPNGSWVMNYSNLAIHRQDEWLATARGFSRYLVGNETYSNANHFGRYTNYGHLEIFPSAQQDSGFSENGWDWNRWSGTTTIHLPLEKLAAQISQIDEYSGIEEMLLSTESYTGATHLNNESALFAMKLRGHDKYQNDLTANKSVFFFGNRIIALGSNINSSDTEHPVETTLFQQRIKDDSDVTYLEDNVLSGLNIDQQHTLTNHTYLLDTNNNAYFVNQGQSIRLMRQTQHSKENEKKLPTSGNFASAIIEHGVAPKNAQYQYSILVNTTNKNAMTFKQALQSDTPPYEIIQHSKALHIVKDNETKTVGIAAFEATNDVNNEFITAIDTPSMLMFSQKNNNLTLGITVPDLNLYQGVELDQLNESGKQIERSIYSRKWRYNSPKPITANIILKGKWQGKGNNYQTTIGNNGQTTLTFTSVAASPIQVTLQQVADHK